MQPNSDTGDGKRYSPDRDLLYDPIQEDIVMNRWQLQIALESIQNESKRPSLDDAFPWIGVLLAFLLALIPNDFQTFLTFSGDVWTAVALLGCLYAGFRVLKTSWEVFKQRNEPHVTAASMVDQMAKDMRTGLETFRQQGRATPLTPLQSVPDTEESQNGST